MSPKPGQLTIQRQIVNTGHQDGWSSLKRPSRGNKKTSLGVKMAAFVSWFQSALLSLFFLLASTTSKVRLSRNQCKFRTLWRIWFHWKLKGLQAYLCAMWLQHYGWPCGCGKKREFRIYIYAPICGHAHQEKVAHGRPYCFIVLSCIACVRVFSHFVFYEC